MCIRDRNTTLDLLLNPAKLARVIEHHARDNQQMSLDNLLSEVKNGIVGVGTGSDLAKEISRNNVKLYLRKLLQLAGNTTGNQQVAALALMHVDAFANSTNSRSGTAAEKAHQFYMAHQIKQFMADPSGFELPEAPALPDGSPIGCGH